MASETQAKPLSQCKFRFSVRGLLLAVFVVALAVSNFVAYQRLRETASTLRDTERSLETLRSEVGELSIRDPDLVHAVAIPSYESMTYRWRVFLPKSRKFYLNTATGQIPEDGLPDSGTSRISSRLFDATMLETSTS
jgi:hypothetical protein